MFSVFELDQIMRQKDDFQFAALLNRLREGLHTNTDISALKSRVIDMDTVDTAVKPHLFTRRSESLDYNDKIFSRTSNKKDNIVAIDCVSGAISYDIHSKILSKIPDDSSKTKGLVKNLNIAENLPAELCINIDVLDGMTNGTPCIVKKLDYRVQDSSRCSIIWVQFEDNYIGKTCRF